MEIKFGNRTIGLNHPTYFIADIAANHDGDMERAKLLIRLAKEAGADAAKFQNFDAPKIVSDYGFKAMSGGQVSHQASWKKSVFEVYKGASIPFGWSMTLVEECNEVGIDYFSSPYDFNAIDFLDQYVPVYKAGSGEIDWIEALERMASKGKPFFVATGASTIGEVQKAVHAILKINKQLVLMQCNTNYTASPNNYDHLHVNVLKTYATMFPDVILGLSDHTHAVAPVIAAVTLGARVIERHFTDSNDREGPDHKFAMNPENWAKMVEETRLLERSLGSADKFIAENEIDTAVVQRRCLRAARDIKAGEVFVRDMIDVLRPATPGAIKPDQINDVIGTKALADMPLGKELCWTDLGSIMFQRKIIIRFVVIAIGIGVLLVALFAFQLGLDNDPGWGPLRLQILWAGIAVIIFGMSYWVGPMVFHQFGNFIHPMVSDSRLIQRLKVFRNRFSSLAPFLQRFDKLRHKSLVSWILKRRTDILLVTITIFTLWLYIWIITAGRMVTWPSGKNYYWMLTQAFQHGQTHLIVDPPPALLELNNPYDYQERKSLDYLWDTTLYNGKYYLYWGPVPAVIGVMVNFVTSKPVTDAGLVFAFSLGVALFSMLLLKVVYYDNKFTGWVFWGGIFASMSNGVLTWTLTRPAYYEASIVGGQFFLVAAYYLYYLAFRSALPKKGYIFFSALALGLAGGTRINLLPSVIFLSLFILWRIYTAFQRKLFISMPALAATIVPLSLVACSLLWYNQIRFGSLLEFGHRFQLTGGSLTDNYGDQISANYLVPNLYTYVFRKPSISENFPFLSVPWIKDHMWPSFIRLPKNYYFTEPVAGILFVIPLIGFTAMLLLRWFWIFINGDASFKEKKDIRTDGLLLPILGCILVQSFVLLVFVSSSMRYLLDISPSIILFSTVFVGQYIQVFEKRPYMVKAVAWLWLSVSLLTVISGLLFGITGPGNNFLNQNPRLFHQLYEWFKH